MFNQYNEWQDKTGTLTENNMKVVEIIGNTSALTGYAALALKLNGNGVFMLEAGGSNMGPYTQIINDAEVKIDIASDVIEGIATDKATKSMSGKAWYLK